MDTVLKIANRKFYCFNSQDRLFLKVCRLSFQYIYRLKKLKICLWFRVKEGISNYEVNICTSPISVLVEKYTNYSLVRQIYEYR